MIVVQFVIVFKGSNQNRLELNVLEREDANDLERKMAQSIESLHRSIFLDIADLMGPGEVVMTEIPPRCPKCGMQHLPGQNTLCTS